MKTLRRLSIAALFSLGLSNAVAQAPPVVPALPDTPRLTSYTIAGTTCACAVNFALYGNANLADYQDWVEVFLNGVRVAYNDPTYGWAITSPTGPLASIARPITDAVLTFANVQTGTVEIVGASRPARLSQWMENQGVSARNLNVAFTGIVAQLREIWDKINDVTGRALVSQPGNTVGPLPLPAVCADGWLGFDNTGLNPVCRAGGTGSGNVIGPSTSTAGDLALWSNATGSLLQDATKPNAIDLGNATNLPASAIVNLGLSSVYNFMTDAQIADAKAFSYAQDDTTAIQNCINSASCFMPYGGYKIASPLTVRYSNSLQCGSIATVIKSFDSTVTDPVVYAGDLGGFQNCTVGFNAGLVTGSETAGQRVGVIAYAPTGSGLQRGGFVKNIAFDNVGTGMWDGGAANTTQQPFSAHFEDLAIVNFSYRGFDFESLFRTQNTYKNIYVSGGDGASTLGPYSTNIDAGFILAGQESETTADGINVEWGHYVNAFRFVGLSAANIGVLHTEEVTLKNNYQPLMIWNKSNGKIGTFSVVFDPIITAGWFVGQIYDSTYTDTGGDNPNTVNQLEIGTLNLWGLNDGTRVSTGNGLTGLTNLYFFDRETNAVGPFSLQIDRYSWQSYQTDTAVYLAFPTDPHAMITNIPTVAGPPVGVANKVPVVTAGLVIAYEAVPNVALANSSLTIDGQSCALGATCARAAGSNSSAASPTAPNSTSTYTMQGLAGSITPATTGSVFISISGTIVSSATTVDLGIIYQVSHGTGSAPTTNGALAGTQDCQTQEYTGLIAATAAGDIHQPFSISCRITGLVIGTAYWLDLAAKAITTANDVSFVNVNIAAIEQ